MNPDIISTVLKKELKELFGDRRAVFLSLLFPLILFPLLFGLMNNTGLFSGRFDPASVKIGMESLSQTEEEADKILNVNLLLRTAGFTIAENFGSESYLADGKTHLVIKFTDNRIILLSDNSRQASLNAAAAAEEILLFYLNNQDPLPGGAESEADEKSTHRKGALEKTYLYPHDRGAGLLALSTLLPVLLLVFSALSPAAAAADLGAGEKERQTLEPLLSNPVSAADILTGKILALSVMGTAGTFSYLTGLALAWKINPGMFGPDRMVFFISFNGIMLVILLTIMLSLIFSSFELALSIYARSAKEAQILFLPVFLLSTAAGYSAAMTDPADIDFIYRHIPLVNISVLIREICYGIISLPDIFLTLLWGSLYIMLSFFIAQTLFRNEKVIFRS